MRHVHKLRATGYADLSDSFDAMPHAELRDRHVPARIKQSLVAPVEEDDGRGPSKRTTPAEATQRGIPPGAPLPPLLSNRTCAASCWVENVGTGGTPSGPDRQLC